MPLRVFRGYSPPDVLSAVASSAVSSVVLSAVSAAPALFPCSSCAGRTTRIGGLWRKAAARLRCSGLVAVTCLLCRIRPGNPAGIVARKILRGCLSGVFCMGRRDPRVVGCRGGQAWTSTGYGFGRKRVSAPYFPTGALRFRLFSKGILPAATVSCTRNCGVEVRHLLGEHPAHDAEEGPAAVVGGVFDRVCEQCLEIVSRSDG